MHTNSLTLLGRNDEVFSGVVWHEVPDNLEEVMWKVQELLDAAYHICENVSDGPDEAQAMVDSWINRWQRTGMVDGS